MLASLLTALPCVVSAQTFHPLEFDLSAHPDAPTAWEGILGLTAQDEDLFVSVYDPVSVGDPRVLVFAREGHDWVPTQTLWPSEAWDLPFVPEQLFGAQVAVEGDLALVSSGYGVAPFVFPRAAVHWYEKEDGQWVERGVFGDGLHPYGTGWSLALVNGVALVGTKGRPTRKLEVWRRDGETWSPDGILDPKEERLLVGKTVADSRGALVGTRVLQYLFEENGSWQRECFPFEASQIMSISLAGSRAVVGSSDFAGAVRVWQRSDEGWVVEQQLTAEDQSREFGTEVALAGEWTVAADGGTGEVHVYRRVGDDWSPWASLSGNDRGSVVRQGDVHLRSDGEFLMSAPGSPPWVRRYGPAFAQAPRGRGLPGGEGRPPTVTTTRESGLVVEVEASRPDALGLLLVSPVALRRPFLGAELLVGAPRRSILFRTGPEPTRLRLLPRGAHPAGRALSLQALVLDPGAEGGVAMSAGLDLTFRELAPAEPAD